MVEPDASQSSVKSCLWNDRNLKTIDETNCWDLNGRRVLIELCRASAVVRTFESENDWSEIYVMSSVQLKSSSEEKMSMYENMVEDLVNSDESSRYMLDGKLEFFVCEPLLPVSVD